MDGLSRASESVARLIGLTGRLLSTLFATLLVLTGLIAIPAHADEEISDEHTTSQDEPSESSGDGDPADGEDPGTDDEPELVIIGSTPTITGDLQVGAKLTANVVDWTPGTEISFQWFRSGQAISGATGQQYVVALDDLGESLSVEVTGSLAGYNPVTAESDPTPLIAKGTLKSATPTITGTKKVDKTLTAKPGTWTTGANLTYKWKADGKVISGATASTYTLKGADAGKKITVEVTGELAGYDNLTKESAETDQVAKGTLTSTKPTIAGTKKVESTLTAKPGTWSTTTLKYQWYRDGTSITGATKSTYKLAGADAGKKITVKVTGSKTGYDTLSKTSAATANITKGSLKATTPTVSGTLAVGSTLTAKPGTWTKSTKFTYQWLRDGKAIPKATKPTYKLVAADAGKKISVKVTGKNTGYTTVSKTSAKTTKTWTAPKPKILGTKTVGQTLTAKPGTWTKNTKFTYQWLRDGKAIPKATKPTYKLVAADASKTIAVKVTGKNSGYTNLSKTSSETAKIANAALKTTKPTITGTATFGKTLTAKTGTWTSGTKFTYQWLRDGKAISKATKPTYKLVAADTGKQISVKVTGTKSGYKTASQTSAKTAKIAKATLKTATPTVAGTVQYGKTVTAKTGTWTSGTAFTYQWYRNGTAISGATKSTYKLAAKDAGKKLTVKVTGKKSGYTTASKTSSSRTYAMSTAQKNAVGDAKSYLSFMSFSRTGLIGQLEYEGYSTSNATFAVDYVAPNWNKQASLSAESYLKYSAFSRSGLIDQLEYEGFTTSQAKYGVDSLSADWYDQAERMAYQYLEYSYFSWDELYRQLRYEGFTDAQATYGTNMAYYGY